MTPEPPGTRSPRSIFGNRNWFSLSCVRENAKPVRALQNHRSYNHASGRGQPIAIAARYVLSTEFARYIISDEKQLYSSRAPPLNPVYN